MSLALVLQTGGVGMYLKRDVRLPTISVLN